MNSEINSYKRLAFEAQKRAEKQEASGDYSIAAGFWRNAAAMWRLFGDEQQAEKCEVKAEACNKQTAGY